MKEKREILHEIKSIGNNTKGEKLRIYVKIPFELGSVEKANFVILSLNGEERNFEMSHDINSENYAYFKTEIFLENSAIYHYCFLLEIDGKSIFYKKKKILQDTEICNNECWKLSVGFETPAWAKDATMYHIFVDRYNKGKNTGLEPLPNRKIHTKWDERPSVGWDEQGRWNIDFFGGNLKGIEEKLSEIKELGVSIIYLSPIVKSQSNHRYDTADYEEVDPYLGSNKTLAELCKKVHEKNMYIILDGVFNHTGNDSKYFNQFGTYDTLGAYQSKHSPYSSFYKKSLDENGNEVFSYWWGMKNLPVCDGNSKKWKKYIFGKDGVIDKWFELGIDGLRLDVADELTDEFLEGIRTAVHRNKDDGLIIGEVWQNPMRMNRGYISSGKCMDSVMNYWLVDSLIRYYKYGDKNKLRNTIDEILTEYPDETIHTLMNFTSTHDISRLIDICSCNCFQKDGEWAWDLEDNSEDFVKRHQISEDEYAYGKKVLKSYITALAFMPGIFSIFYGDEVGLEGIGNLMNRSTYPWENQDMDLKTFFKEIGMIRKNCDFLPMADLNILNLTEEYIIFEREYKNKSIMIATSRVSNNVQIDLPEKYLNGKVLFSLNDSNEKYLGTYGAIIIEAG